MVSNNIEDKLNNLQKPTIIIEKSFDDVLNENIEILKGIIPNYQPLESDRYMKLLRVLSLKETQNQIDRNDVISQLLISTAEGSNLDHLGARFDVFRLGGSKPYALYEISTSKVLSSDIQLPKGLTLTDEAGLFKAYLLEDAVIPAGADKVSLKFELDTYIATTDIKTEMITTPLPFVLKAKAIQEFNNGATAESDSRYRVRIIESLGKYSTAGSKASYIYWTKSADTRIDDVAVISPAPCIVEIYIASYSRVDALMIDRVEQNLSGEKVRPLSDEVAVYEAQKHEITLNATIYIFDLSNMAFIEKSIKENFNSYKFLIGQHLTKTEVIKNLQVAGTYKVEIDFEDIKTSIKEIIEIKEINLTFAKAQV